MHALMSAVKIDPAGSDQAVEMLHGFVVPTAKAAPGFVAGYWIRDEANGMGYSIEVFESEEAAQAASEARPPFPEDSPVSLANIQVLPILANA